MPMSVLRVRGVRGANAMMAAVYGGNLAMFFVLILYVQGVEGYSAVKTGLAFLPFPPVFGLVSTGALTATLRPQALAAGYGAGLAVAAGLTFLAAVVAVTVMRPARPLARPAPAGAARARSGQAAGESRPRDEPGGRAAPRNAAPPNPASRQVTASQERNPARPTALYLVPGRARATAREGKTQMSENKVLTDLVLSDSTVHATINAPLGQVDLADWLANLSDEEYQRCAPGEHKACAHGVTDDGRPETLNVEMIGTTLTIQHAVHEVFTPHHLRLVSLSDALTPTGWTTSQGIWELRVTDNGDGTCRLSNSIVAHPTTEGMAFYEANGLTFAQAATARQEASDAHNHRETPNYAASITRRALASRGQYS